MENAYGIGITNRYSCFLDNEDDPVEALKANEVDKEAKKKETGSGTATTTGPRKGIRDSNKGGNEANKQNNKITNNGVAGRPARGPRPTAQDPKNVKFNEEDREDRNNRRNRDDAPREPRPDGEFNRGPRRPPGQFKPRGGAPGSGRPRGPPGAPGTGGERGSGGGGERGGMRKREFDRQSGSDKSGVKPVDKRDGAGSRNWGTYKDDLEEATTAAPADETMDEKNDSSQEITETGDAGEVKSEEQNENQEPEDPAQKFMTLDEWKAMQQPKAKPVYNLRKAGEGEDQTQWKKMILKKKEEQEEEGEEEEYEEDYDCPQRAGRQKQILDIDFHFADSRRGGTGGRGGRGGRGAGRGGDRGPRPPRPAGDRERRERDPEREPREPRERGERAPAAPGTGNNGNGSGAGRGDQTNAGGFRNRNTRFGNRYETPRSQTAPKVDDVNDFPSLG